MREIAATLDSAGMPPEFHQAAAEVFEMMREFKNVDGVSIEDVLSRLRAS